VIDGAKDQFIGWLLCISGHTREGLGSVISAYGIPSVDGLKVHTLGITHLMEGRRFDKPPREGSTLVIIDLLVV